MLRLQLDAHPELSIPPETGFGSLLAGLGDDGLAPGDLLTEVARLPTWQDLGITHAEAERAIADLPEWSVPAGLRAFYRLYAARQGKQRWGDKTPGHVHCIEALAVAFHEAHFVHLIRDGRDVAASLQGMPFAPEGGIGAIGRAWRDGVAAARRSGARVPHYLEVHYERLVTEPEGVLREICDFIDLKFDDWMLRAHERAEERLAEIRGVTITGGRARLADGGAEVTARTLDPPDPTPVGRWHEALDRGEVATFEAEAGGVLSALGYERSASTRWSSPHPRSAERAGERAEPLRLVIGLYSLAHPGGTETYVLTVARELARLGHELVITAEVHGQMADLAESWGLPVARYPSELPQVCDTVFVQDAIMGATLAERYPEARLVHFLHSDIFDPQLPLLLPGVVDAVVSASERTTARVEATPLGITPIRMRQPIDTERFSNAGPISERPTRALVLSNYLHGERRRMLVDAWEAAGVEVEQVGGTRSRVDVLDAIARSDIVVGKARAALEGMSRARAVYIYDEFGGDGWVTPESYPALEADAFAGLAGRHTRTGADLAADLERYEAAMGPINRELIRRHHSARRHATALVDVLRGPRSERAREGVALHEVARLTRSAWYWEVRASHLQAEAGHHAGRARAAEEELARMRRRHADQAAKNDRLQIRADRSEQDLRRTRALVKTRRVRAGVAVGRLLDRVRSWR